MSNEGKNFVDNSELVEYLKSRKEAQTEIEIKNIMTKIYESVAKNSKLIYAFSSSIEPKVDENGDEQFDTSSLIKPALIYSDRAEPYLPVYTSFEESQNRSTKEQFPYLRQLDFYELSSMVLNSNGAIEGIVLNPFSDNLVLNKSKVQYMSNMKNDNSVEKVKENDEIQNKVLSKASVTGTAGVYTKADNKKSRILVNEYDLRILEYNMLPTRVMKMAIAFARKIPAIMAMWVFDKRYYLPNDNTQYLAQLFVIEDNLQSEEERNSLYEKFKEITLPESNAMEVHVESIEKQANDFVRKNAIMPFYQKINVEGQYTNSEFEYVSKNEVEKHVLANKKEEVSAPGWDAIEAELFRIYPNQINPRHYAPIIKAKFGGPDPLDGISVYDAGEYWHFVTYGISELYEKVNQDEDISGFGFEFTFKLKKGCYDDEEKEIKATCNMLQQVSKIVVFQKQIIKPYEYLYTGQQTGVDSQEKSKITGFITVPDREVNILNTPNGKVEFVELIGATDRELKAVQHKDINVRELYEALKTDVTDYNRASIDI